MVLGLTNWYWLTNRKLIPGENCFSSSQHTLVACIRCLGVGPCEISPFPVSVSFGVVLVQVLRPCGWCSLSFLGDTTSQQISWSILFLPIFLWCLLSLGGRRFVVDVATEAGHLEILCSLNIDKLWFSVMVSVCCNRTFLWWGVTASFTCRCKDKLT